MALQSFVDQVEDVAPLATNFCIMFDSVDQVEDAVPLAVNFCILFDKVTCCRMDWKLEAHRAADRVKNPQQKAIHLQGIALGKADDQLEAAVKQQGLEEEEATQEQEGDTSRLLTRSHSESP